MPTAPTDLRENLLYRQKIIQLGNESESARDDIWIACSRDPVFFVNTFGWTFDPQNFGDVPDRALVMWPHQEDAFRRVISSIGKHGLIFPKTRRMGVSTLILAAFFWRWMFRAKQTFLLLSAKEDRVDKRGDPSSLMFKLDYMNECLPTWLRANVDRANLRFGNPENGSIINGESTNKDPDRGGVRTAVLADEVGVMGNGGSVIDSIAPLTESMYLVSTPQGAFGAFYEMYVQMLRNCPERVVLLHWTKHSLFSKGLYFTDEPVSGYVDPAWGGRKPRSPWYDKECLKLTGPKRIAQELDISFNDAGGPYFENTLLDKLIRTTVRKPTGIGDLDEDGWHARQSGRLHLWYPLDETARPPHSRYGIGCDIATGKGGDMSSQSALSILDLRTGEKVAEFKDKRITPERFARLAVEVAKWFHDAKLIWGSQGPGAQFGVIVTRDCGYGNVYYRKDEETISGKKTRKLGYTEMGVAREVMFGSYRDALHEGRFINRSQEAVEECRQFIYGPDGSVQHSKAIQRDQDPENKNKNHGDIVVADALANRLLGHAKISTSTESAMSEAMIDPPFGSPAWKMREYVTRKNKSPFYSLSK